jgi:hypothetical protein
MSLYEEYDALRKDSRDTRIFAMGLLSAGLVIIALVQGVKTGIDLLFSERAVATVTAVRTERIPGSRGATTRYWPTLRFQGPTGTPYNVATVEPFNSRLVVGQVLPIRFDPGNPADAKGASAWDLWGFPTLSGVLGAFGVMCFLLWRSRQVAAGAVPETQG